MSYQQGKHSRMHVSRLHNLHDVFKIFWFTHFGTIDSNLTFTLYRKICFSFVPAFCSLNVTKSCAQYYFQPLKQCVIWLHHILLLEFFEMLFEFTWLTTSTSTLNAAYIAKLYRNTWTQQSAVSLSIPVCNPFSNFTNIVSISLTSQHKSSFC